MERQINPRIIEILKEYNVDVENSLAYLLILHYNLKPTFIPQSVISNVQVLKIVEKALDNTGLQWHLPLFSGEETAFGWVKTEYVTKFKAKNTERGGRVREATLRMKKFFAKNPEYRKEDVLLATENYLASTGHRYIMLPHYFIEKGKGVEKTCTLLTWLEMLKELGEKEKGRSSHSNTMAQ